MDEGWRKGWGGGGRGVEEMVGGEGRRGLDKRAGGGGGRRERAGGWRKGWGEGWRTGGGGGEEGRGWVEERVKEREKIKGRGE